MQRINCVYLYIGSLPTARLATFPLLTRLPQADRTARNKCISVPSLGNKLLTQIVVRK